jgi:hypothetical protein
MSRGQRIRIALQVQQQYAAAWCSNAFQWWTVEADGSLPRQLQSRRSQAAYTKQWNLHGTLPEYHDTCYGLWPTS